MEIICAGLIAINSLFLPPVSQPITPTLPPMETRGVGEEAPAENTDQLSSWLEEEYNKYLLFQRSA